MGLGVAASLSVLSGHLEHGGVSVLLVLLVVAALSVRPVSQIHLGRAQSPLGHAGRSALKLWFVFTISAGTVTLAAQAPSWAWILAIGLWPIVLLVTWLSRDILIPASVIGLALATLGGGSLASSFPGWSLLEAHWETWGSWLGYSIGAGLLLTTPVLALAGDPFVSPVATRRTMWRIVSLGFFLVLGMSSLAASVWEFAWPLATYCVVGLVLTAWFSASISTLSLGKTGLERLVLACSGALAIGLFWSCGETALDMWWSTLLPLGVAAAIACMAIHQLPKQRLQGLVIVAIAGLGALLSFPGFPSPQDTMAIAILIVVTIWIAGTRAVLIERRAA